MEAIYGQQYMTGNTDTVYMEYSRDALYEQGSILRANVCRLNKHLYTF